MRRARLIMNLTSLLDVLILLFFAQAIFNWDSTQKAHERAAQGNEATRKAQVRADDLQVRLDAAESAKAEYDRLLQKEKADCAQLKQELEQKTQVLEQQGKDLAETKDAHQQLCEVMHILDDKLDLEQIKKMLHLDESTSSEVTVQKLIEEMQCQRYIIQNQNRIQEQTQKEIAIWVIILESSPAMGPSLRLFINGAEKDLTQVCAKWNFQDEIALKEQLQKVLCSKDAVSNSDISNTNLVLWFTSKQHRALSSEVKLFASVFADAVMYAGAMYTANQSPEFPNGRGKIHIHMVPIESNINNPDISIDPSLLDNSQIKRYSGDR